MGMRELGKRSINMLKAVRIIQQRDINISVRLSQLTTIAVIVVLMFVQQLRGHMMSVVWDFIIKTALGRSV